MEFVNKYIVVDFKNISVFVFDMLTIENGKISLYKYVSCHFFHEKLECSERIWNPDKCKCEYPKCNSKLDKDIY